MFDDQVIASNFYFQKVSSFLETEQPKKSAQIRGVKSPFTQGGNK